MSGHIAKLGDGVRRLLAANPSPMTLHGTNTYLPGYRDLAVIDPGPDDRAHLRAILDAAGDAPIRQILVTHAHMDHSPLASALSRFTGAPVLDEGRWYETGARLASAGFAAIIARAAILIRFLRTERRRGKDPAAGRIRGPDPGRA